MNKFDDKWTPLEPIYDVIRASMVTLKEIYNPNHVIFGLNHSRKSIKKGKIKLCN